MVQVEGIQVDLGRHGQLISSVDLRPARDPGRDPVNAPAGPQLDQVVLVEERGPRADKAHIPFEDADRLRQFIDTERPFE